MEIDIGTVLAKLDDTVDEHTGEVKEYGIKFLKSNGLIREMRCRKNVKSPKQQIGERDPRGKGLFNLKLHGTILLQDLDQESPKTVKVAMICGFRNHKGSNWYDVRH